MKTKTFIIIVAALLCFVFILPSILAFFPDFKNKDSVGNVDNNGGVAHNYGRRTIASYNFSEPLVFNNCNDYDDYKGVLNEGSIKYGSINTDGGYFEFENDVAGVKNNPYFGFYANSNQEDSNDGLDLFSCDFITIDYDMWSDNVYPDGMTLRLDVRDSDYVFTRTDGKLTIFSSDEKKIVSSDGTEFEFDSMSDVIHYTWVVAIDHEDLSSSVAYVYINGSYVFTLENIFSDDVLLFRALRFDANMTFTTTGSESLCVDNFVINIFGSGDGSYDGELISLFNDKDISLYDCSDSILYRKS